MADPVDALAWSIGVASVAVGDYFRHDVFAEDHFTGFVFQEAAALDGIGDFYAAEVEAGGEDVDGFGQFGSCAWMSMGTLTELSKKTFLPNRPCSSIWSP